MTALRSAIELLVCIILRMAFDGIDESCLRLIKAVLAAFRTSVPRGAKAERGNLDSDHHNVAPSKKVCRLRLFRLSAFAAHQDFESIHNTGSYHRGSTG